MKIKYMGYEHGVMTDAPFIGMRVGAIQCHNGCPGCFNQGLQSSVCQEIEVSDLINLELGNPLDTGIILGGLEWSEQPEDLKLIVKAALEAEIYVMIYTHHSIEEFLELFPEFKGEKILVKCGAYRQDLPTKYDSNYDVLLASSNQYIEDLRGF